MKEQRLLVFMLECIYTSKRVIVESIKGQIAGGLIDAIYADSADVGNRMEMRTLINIRGFDRFAMQNTLMK